MGVVVTAEQQRRPFAGEVLLERGRDGAELGGQLGIGRLLDELEQSERFVGPRRQSAPELDLGAQAVGFTEDPLGGALVVPEPGFEILCVELGDAALLRLEVKDAPRSTGSARPGRERRMRPSVPDLEILEQDRSELDQAEGLLAPGDDGVHAGTIAVVGADAAVAVTVECRCIAARPTIPLAGDEIDERGFLGLLHGSLSSAAGRIDGRGVRGAMRAGLWAGTSRPV
jgi:hypothetical protein